MPAFETPQPISVTVEIGLGDLQIEASDRGDTIVEVRPSDSSNQADVTAARETSVDYANGSLRVRAPRGWKRFSLRGGGESIDVRIELPTGSRLNGEAGLATLRCRGAVGDCRFKTGAGDLAVEHLTGTSELVTGMGRVGVERSEGRTVVRNANGDTWIGEAAGELEVKASNGRIGLDRALAGVTAKAANGDIRLGEVARGAIAASTACGSVSVGVRTGAAVWLDLNTGFGHVRNLLDDGGRPEPSEDVVEIRARSSFGDITVSRTGADRSGPGGQTSDGTSKRVW